MKGSKDIKQWWLSRYPYPSGFSFDGNKFKLVITFDGADNMSDFNRVRQYAKLFRGPLSVLNALLAIVVFFIPLVPAPVRLLLAFTAILLAILSAIQIRVKVSGSGTATATAEGSLAEATCEDESEDESELS